MAPALSTSGGVALPPQRSGPEPVSLLVPGSGGAGPGEGSRSERTTRSRGRVRARGPLPLAQVPAPRAGTAVYGVSALDCHGRIADRVVLGALGWTPGTRLEITGDRRTITVRADTEDQTGAQTNARVTARAAARVIRSRVTPQGHVRLPAEVRHACGMAAGDRVLLIADPAAGVLRVVSPATLDDLVSGLTTSEPASHNTDGTDSAPDRPRGGRVDVPSRREQR